MPHIQPRALSISQGRAVGFIHYILGGILSTWAFFISRPTIDGLAKFMGHLKIICEEIVDQNCENPNKIHFYLDHFVCNNMNTTILEIKNAHVLNMPPSM